MLFFQRFLSFKLLSCGQNFWFPQPSWFPQHMEKNVYKSPQTRFMYAHTYIHAYIDTYTHTYIHTYIHTYKILKILNIPHPPSYNAVEKQKQSRMKLKTCVTGFCCFHMVLPENTMHCGNQNGR